MTAYLCYQCGVRFDELKTIRQSQGECFGFPAWEALVVCPICGSPDIDRPLNGDEDDDEETI